MNLHVKKSIAEKIGIKEFIPFGVPKDRWTHYDFVRLSIAGFSPKKLEALRALLEKNKSVSGVGVLLRDIATWNTATSDAGGAKPRTVEQFVRVVTAYLQGVAGHRVYERTGEDVWLPYYVNEVKFHEAIKHGSNPHPAFAVIVLLYEEFGGIEKETITFYESDVRAIPVREALARKGYYAETNDKRAAHLAELDLFSERAKSIGKQFFAIGTGTDDLDGNGSYSRSRYHANTIQLVRNGQPTRVVIDVFYEDDKTDRDERKRNHPDRWFWHNRQNEVVDEEGDDDVGTTVSGVDKEEDGPGEVEVPIHPFLAVFDLSKHLRLRVHVSLLTEYVYDARLADKLVLSKELKSLVAMLIEHKDGGFRDIVKGKGGGAVVLLAGKPGVGKTLTAEVYAESEQRALYSVQCSQLGTDPDELESRLLTAFGRARRWNAVTLLDEADVYVHERGRDMRQNAIVGVFLRVLEYQDTVLFLTTNRPDDVDDAIASRCIARLSYSVPTQEEQARIWGVLSEGSGAKLHPDVIQVIVEQNPGLTGRDVKNLLKLALLVQSSRKDGRPITPGDIEFVKQFQPTIRHSAKEEPPSWAT